MTSQGRAWGIILLCALAGAGACDTDDRSDGSDRGAAGEQPRAGTASADAGAPPSDEDGRGGATGGQATGVGGNQGGQIAQAGGASGGQVAVGGHVGIGGQAHGGEAGQSFGEGAQPKPPGCPDDASGGAYSRWDWLDGAGGSGGADADAEFHRILLGTGQIAIAINDSGQMLVTSGFGDPDAPTSCQAWVVDAHSVSEVTTGVSGCVVAVDMNEAGTVLASQDSVPFLWKDGVVTPLAGVSSGIPVALNDAEQVLLTASSVGPALWEAGTLTPLLTPAHVTIEPAAINEGGQIIGHGAGVTGGTWLWDDGIATPLELDAVHALNDLGEIAGVKDNATGVLSGGTFVPLPFSNEARVYAMTNDGVVVGDVYDIDEPILAQPVRVEAGVARYLGVYGSARDINRHGEIVGRRTAISSGPPRCLECFGVAQFWPTLWLQSCPSACCAP